jgi:hypothetical protein
LGEEQTIASKQQELRNITTKVLRALDSIGNKSPLIYQGVEAYPR